LLTFANGDSRVIFAYKIFSAGNIFAKPIYK